MADTTIGYAVLQLIPSLKGVTEAIDKQISGKTIPVDVEPKVDPAKVDKSVKDAVNKSKPPEVKIETKVDQKKLDEEIEATKKKILKGAKDWDEFNRRTAEKWAKEQAEKAKAAAEAQGKESGKAIADATAQAIKNAPGAVEAGKKLGKDIAENASNVIKEGFGTRLKNAISGLEIGKTLRDEITNALKTDPAGAIGGVADALRAIGQAHAADEVGKFGEKVGAMQTEVATMKGNLEETAKNFSSIAEVSPRAASGLSQISGAAGPLALVFTALTNFMPGFNDSLSKIEAGKGTWKDWAEVMMPLLHTLEQIEQKMLHILDLGKLPVPMLDTTPGALGLPKDPRQPAPVVNPQTGAPVPAPVQTPPPLGDLAPMDRPGHAGGGTISGPGNGTSDSILARVSNGEYIVNAAATRKNLALLEAINSGKIPTFGEGGLVAGAQQLRKIIMERFGISDIGGYRAPDGYNEHSTGRALDVMVGSNKAKGDAVKDFALANASAIDLKWAIWQQRMWYPGGRTEPMSDRGSPTQNHMDHVHIFSGTGITNGLLGALRDQGSMGPKGPVFSQAGMNGVGDGAVTAAAAAGAVPAAAAAAGGSSGGGSGGSFSLPSSLTDMSGFGLSGLGKGIGATSGGSDLGLIGNAAASAVSGQVDSLLGSFGVPSTPRWLQGLSQFVGGISVGGHSLGGATPISAAIPMASGPASIPADAGQQQSGGVGAIYNIKTATVEDAFMRAQRLERERAAAKLDRY